MSKKMWYEVTFAVLALVAVSIAFADLLNKIPNAYQNMYFIADKIILVIFAIDYFVHLYLAKDKKAYFKNNIFELLSILPLDSLFRGFRLFRIIRIVRILFLAKRVSGRFTLFLNTNGFIYVLMVTIATVFLGACSIYYLENGVSVDTFGDALWWSFVTVTTVGYGDISPATAAGRIVAVILMIVGIGFIGMLTGTIATFFIRKPTSKTVNNQNQILDLSDLDSNKYLLVKEYCEFIRNKE